MRWPKPTAEIAKLLAIPEHLIRYQLRSGGVQDDRLPALINGRLLWWPPSVLALIDALEHAGRSEFRVGADLRAVLDAAAATVTP